MKIYILKKIRTVFLFLFISGLFNGCVLNQTNYPLSRADPASILLSISEPISGEKYPVTGALTISAEAVSDDPIRRMELWVDGELVDSYTPSTSILRFLAHSWTWTSPSLGEHTLIVRAYNDEENPAQSNVLNLTSIEDPGFVILYKIIWGDTLEVVAQRYEVTVAQILKANPQITASEPLQLGSLLRIPIGTTEPISQAAPLDLFIRKDPALWGEVQLIQYNTRTRNGFGPVMSLAAPSLVASVQGCNVTLTSSFPGSKATGYLIYRLNQGGPSFTKIASLPANGDGKLTYQDAGLSTGKYQYHISAYTSGMFATLSENPSNIVMAEISQEACAGNDLTIYNLLPAAKGIQQIYLYLTVNDKDWMRFPQGQFNFMGPDQQVNFGEMLGMLALSSTSDLTLQGEGWGWDNGKLIHLGNFKRMIPASASLASQAPSDLAQFLQTELQARGIGLSDSKGYNWVTDLAIGKYELRNFRWGTNTDADLGVWQVASQPFPNSPSLNPPCLLLTDKVPPGTLQSPTAFDIDFSSLAPQPLQVSSIPKNPVFTAGQILFPGVSPVSPPYSPTILMGDQPVQQKMTSPVFINPCNFSKSAEGVITYYVRILPIKNNQLLPTPSNQVVVKYSAEPGIQITIEMAPYVKFYDVKILEFTEMNVPNLAYKYCVKVTKNPYYQKFDMTINPKWSSAAPGSTICPDAWEDDSSWLEDIGSFIEKAVNYVSKLYDKLSEYVTELVEKLNPMCFQAKFIADAVGTGEDEVDQVCHLAAVIVVAAAKTYVGMPPSLPNFDQLTNMGKDYMVELAADELEANGIPCPQECKDLIKEGVNYSIDQLKKAVSSPACMGDDEAHSQGIEPLCPPDGVEFVLAPQGQPAPPTAVVRVTRTAESAAVNIPQPASCYVSLGGIATNSSYVGKTLDLWWLTQVFHWQGTQLNASLVGASSPIPSLAPNQYVDIPFVLKPTPFWLPGHYKWYHQWIEVPTYDDWTYLYQGANLTLKADGACFFPGMVSTFQHVQGEQKNYGPLGNAYQQTCFPDCP